jgi:hypothetical protein
MRNKIDRELFRLLIELDSFLLRFKIFNINKIYIIQNEI